MTEPTSPRTCTVELDMAEANLLITAINLLKVDILQQRRVDPAGCDAVGYTRENLVVLRELAAKIQAA